MQRLVRRARQARWEFGAVEHELRRRRRLLVAGSGGGGGGGESSTQAPRAIRRSGSAARREQDAERRNERGKRRGEPHARRGRAARGGHARAPNSSNSSGNVSPHARLAPRVSGRLRTVVLTAGAPPAQGAARTRSRRVAGARVGSRRAAPTSVLRACDDRGAEPTAFCLATSAARRRVPAPALVGALRHMADGAGSARSRT